MAKEMDKEKQTEGAPAPAQNRIWIILGGICAGVVLLVILVILSLGGGEEPDPGPSEAPAVSTAPTPDLGILMDDIYEGKRYVPRFDYPLNTYDPEKFALEDGFIRYDSPKAVLGVDVSEFQGEIDWQQVKAAGIDFCILRVGYRGQTKGVLNEDEAFVRNLEGAEAAGLKVGVYFFSQAVSESEARKEADFVLERIKGHTIDYPIVFDWEPPIPGGDLDADDLRAYGMPGWQVTNFAAAFCKRVEDAGYIPCVYTNKTMAYEFFDLEAIKEYDLWYAEYQPAPSLYYGFRMWQYASDWEVPGIPGTVDMDICFEDY